jgi:serine acetyltransferase
MRVTAGAKMQTARAVSPHASTWQTIKEALQYNAPLGDYVIWLVSVDYQRALTKLPGYGRADRLFHLAFSWEWWAVAHYRLYHWAHRRAVPDLVHYPLLRRLLILQQGALLRFCYSTGKIIEGLSGARLAAEAEIGPGLLLIHTGSCGIGVGARIGANFTLHQDANIVARRGNDYAVIGDNVTMYSGARIIGPVHIGDNVKIGANSVVTHDLPEGCTAIGAPAKPVQPGERPGPYPPSALISDLLTTYTEAGVLQETASGEYLDRSTGAIITTKFAETRGD